ncbi:unnamed protein product [Lasius platythorax]|uniref:Uncharacterized protein n=1 Tax=Lasius platythorax TaxID=488582 RepID=A0AAV2P320_9HYME
MSDVGSKVCATDTSSRFSSRLDGVKKGKSRRAAPLKITSTQVNRRYLSRSGLLNTAVTQAGRSSRLRYLERGSRSMEGGETPIGTNVLST